MFTPRRSPLALALLAAFASPAYAADVTLPTVEITATKTDTPVNQYRRERAASGALGDKTLVDTPFSIEVSTAELLKNTQASTINDAFRYDASVTAINNGYIGEASGIAIRGLQLDLLNGFKIDGLAVPNWGSDLPLEHYEEIQLLKGLGGFMYGFGSPGGIANFVSKRPTSQPLASVSVGYQNTGTLLASADLGGRLGEGKRFGYRLNVAHEEGDTFVDDGHVKRDSLSFAGDIKLTDNLLWSFDTLYQKRRVDGAYYGVILGQDFGYPVNASVPEALDGSQRIASPFTYYETEYKIAGTDLLWAINPDWDVKLSYRYAQQNRLNHDSGIVLSDTIGTYSEAQYGGYSTYDFQTVQALATGKLQTGSIRHDVVLGAAWQLMTQYWGNTPYSYAYLGTGNLYNPGNFANAGLPDDRTQYKNADTTQKSLFASDTVQFSDQWSALVGVRYTAYDQDTFDTTGSKTASYNENPLTPTLALIYKPDAITSVYGSYVEALEQGGGAPVTSRNAGTVFGPLKSRQYEVGFKLADADWSANAALFRIEKGLEYLNGANYYVQDGTEVHQGLDLNAKAQLARDWTLMGSVMWQQTENVDAGADVNGKRAYGAPNVQASAYVEYAVPQLAGLVMSGGTQYVGSRPIEATNANMLDSYVLFNLGARYATRWNDQKMTLRLNLDNVANEKYWTTSWGFILTQGAPRTIKASAQFDF
ncbi:Ferrichrome receptor FcuA [Andreprevotia sp. IGB-42]|uniref:TonB-dependent siderophore receptor n=1 Tax=Andreprevotia sp. IGB-42 TaxID=2497473 RepID=UPI001359BC6C|nr:TonB-dependent siderophore receptor [Andreprevotia sp. IGB-42]KAF0814749.1 Ferrichrome receptor FcuA [Andreprevotia sp. IGB-42]